MLYKSTSYDISTPAAAPRRSHLRTALLALPIIGLAIAVANVPSAHASISVFNQHGTLSPVDPGTTAIRLTSDAITRAIQNRNISDLRYDEPPRHRARYHPPVRGPERPAFISDPDAFSTIYPTHPSADSD